MSYYLDEFVAFLSKEKCLSANSILSYKGDLRSFYSFLKTQGIGDMEKINKTNVMAYLLELKKQGKSNSTVSRNTSTLKAFIRYLYENNIVANDFAKDIKAPKFEKKMPQVLTIEEVDMLLEMPGQDDLGLRDKAMLELIYATGIRVSELVNLKIKDVDLIVRCVHCYSSGKHRMIPMGNMAVQAMDTYLKQARPNLINQNNNDILFLNFNGNPMTRQGFWKILKGYAKKGEINKSITPHMLRHSFAVHMLNNGADIYSMQELLGHSDIATTQVYMKCENNKVAEVYAKAHPRY